MSSYIFPCSEQLAALPDQVVRPGRLRALRRIGKAPAYQGKPCIGGRSGHGFRVSRHGGREVVFSLSLLYTITDAGPRGTDPA